jgi:hypothetical protein
MPSIAAQESRVEAATRLEGCPMVESQSEIQTQLEAANLLLMEKRRALGIRDDRPVHVGDVVDGVLAELIRQSEASRVSQVF